MVTVSNSKPKYHHLVPQCYLSAWATGEGTLLLEDIRAGQTIKKNMRREFGIKQFHTIKAGMPFCNRSDAERLFACLKDYRVEYGGKQIIDSLDLNGLYFDFDNWIIIRADGKRESNKKIKREIEQASIVDIENEWAAQVENDWAQIVKDLLYIARLAGEGPIPEFKREAIIRFCIVQDWRSSSSRNLVNEEFERIDKEFFNGNLELMSIPVEEQWLSCVKNEKDEIRHDFLLNCYRKYQNGTGLIEQEVDIALKKTTFELLLSNGPALFITSDNPSFICQQDEFTGRLMAVSPHLFLRQVCNSSLRNKYYVRHATNEDVSNCNELIRSHASRLLVLPQT